MLVRKSEDCHVLDQHATVMSRFVCIPSYALFPNDFSQIMGVAELTTIVDDRSLADETVRRSES